MAIFDSEKRPRGLRVPSLTALKSSATKSQFSLKKSSDSVPSDESSSPKPAAFPAPPPPKPAPPPDKELPLPPKVDIPASSDNPYFPPIPRNEVPERRPIQRVPVPTQSPPRTTGMRTKKSQPDFHAPQQPTPATPSSPPQIPTIVQDPAPVPAAAPAPADEANSPQLEEFIPTPESAEPPAVPEQPREELAPSPFVPPDVEPVAPKLNEIHLTCYQQHRAMPVAQNTWCPMPCMTCQKFDIEIRHRCVFCCLRICDSCYQTLQKCKDRSVEELVDRIVA